MQGILAYLDHFQLAWIQAQRLRDDLDNSSLPVSASGKLRIRGDELRSKANFIDSLQT
jgi:hypothetical protein